MPLNPKSLQGLRSLFKPAEAAISTAPEIKGALTTIAESPQAPSLLEAVMNKDMSRREFMKRAAATTANQAIPNAVKSLAVKELAKKTLSPSASTTPALKKLTEEELAKYMNWGKIEDPGDLIYTVEEGLSYLNPGYLDEAFGFRVDPEDFAVYYNPNTLKDVIKQMKIGKKAFKSDRQWYGDADSDVSNAMDMMEGIKAAEDPAYLRKLEWQDAFGIPKKSDPEYSTYQWYVNPKTPQEEADAWIEGIGHGFDKKYRELNPLAYTDPRVKSVDIGGWEGSRLRQRFPNIGNKTLQFSDTVEDVMPVYGEVLPNEITLKDYLQDYLRGMEP